MYKVQCRQRQRTKINIKTKCLQFVFLNAWTYVCGNLAQSVEYFAL